MLPGLQSHPTAAVIVTLSHKTTYSDAEEVAFRHVRRYLGSHDKYVLIPQSHRATYPGFLPKHFPDKYFGSARAHGALLLSKRFYEAFLDYDYILIYHLDALVFRDDLLEWCRLGYDYIGAPWLISPDHAHITEEKVGIGGFSLRRVRSFLRVLNSTRYFVEPDEWWRRYSARLTRSQRLLNIPRKYLKRLHVFNDVRRHVQIVKRDKVNEDRFYTEYAAHYAPGFRIPPVDVGLRFAFEAEPRRSYERLGRQLPFGAHRWEHFDRAFYEPFLLTSGPGSEVVVDGSDVPMPEPGASGRPDWSTSQR
jgi:hypothetical protein